MREFIDIELQANDEPTAEHLQRSWKVKFTDVNVSLSTIKMCSQKMGRLSTLPHYCQLIYKLNVPCDMNFYKGVIKNSYIL